MEIEDKGWQPCLSNATLIKNNVRLDAIVVNQEQQIKQLKEQL